MLAMGYTPSQIVRILEEELPRITTEGWSHSSSALRWARRFFWMPFRSRFSSGPRLDFLRRCFGNKTMADLRRYIIVTAFRVDPAYVLPEDIISGGPVTPLATCSGTMRHRGSIVSGPRVSCWGPVLFTNLPASHSSQEPADGPALLVDVAMRATATPIYFPVYQVIILLKGKRILFGFLASNSYAVSFSCLFLFSALLLYRLLVVVCFLPMPAPGPRRWDDLQ